MKPEKIDLHPGQDPKYRKEVKKQTKRLLRRERKKDPEDAPTKVREVTMGWCL